MDMKEVKELVGILENSTLATLEISENGKTIKLGKYPSSGEHIVNAPVDLAAHEEVVTEAKPKGEIISSPMVGVFYRKPSPDAKAYVEVGDKVTKGQTLCIIEAMKLMNEIVAERDGVITEIYPKDGDLVEYGQELFAIGD